MPPSGKIASRKIGRIRTHVAVWTHDHRVGQDRSLTVGSVHRTLSRHRHRQGGVNQDRCFPGWNACGQRIARKNWCQTAMCSYDGVGRSAHGDHDHHSPIGRALDKRRDMQHVAFAAPQPRPIRCRRPFHNRDRPPEQRPMAQGENPHHKFRKIGSLAALYVGRGISLSLQQPIAVARQTLDAMSGIAKQIGFKKLPCYHFSAHLADRRASAAARKR